MKPIQAGWRKPPQELANKNFAVQKTVGPLIPDYKYQIRTTVPSQVGGKGVSPHKVL